jgi:peptidoglycan/xylan/chitin deacetylase (PgdA/CDA1 family)
VTLDRRSFLTLAAAGVATGVLAACGASGDEVGSTDAAGPGASDPVASSSASSEPDTTAGTDTGNVTSPDTVGTWVVRGPSDTDHVALTFHTDGPTSMVTAVLDLVEERDLVITTFIVGSWLASNPAMGRRIVDGGHDIANHTTTHPSFESLTPAQMATEIEGCRATLEQATGTPGRWFRPSGTDNGIDSPSAAALAAAGEAGYTVIGYDIDPLDYKDPGAKAVTDRTLAETVGGSIVSLHMGHQGTIDALPAILDGLEAKGLKPVSLSTLLG